MKTSTVIYHGDLRTVAIHERSGSQIISDAPIDNKGKGQAFSPTDMVATALASCMLTIMGIKANEMEIDISGAKAEVLKIMTSEGARRINKIEIDMDLPFSFDEKTKRVLEKAAVTCPVYLSLSENLEKEITFNWKT